MPRRRNHVPTYRLHKRSGRAIVTLYGLTGPPYERLLPGPFGSPESKEAYARICAEYATDGGRMLLREQDPKDVYVVDLLLAFKDHLETYATANELKEYRQALRKVRLLYALTPAAQFGPAALKAVRTTMVEAGWCRNLVNQRVGRVKRMFRWAAAEELVPAGVYEALRLVPGLKKGRTAARETDPVGPVPDAYVDAVEPFVTRHVWGLVRFQRLTGCRPGEACRLKAVALDTSGDVWLYRPKTHKTAHRGKDRVIAVGPKAQAVVKEFLVPDVQAYLFSPRRCRDERYAAMRAKRKTKVQPSQRGRAKAKPKRRPGEHYTPTSYAAAIAKACVKAGVPHWHPNQIRHTFATAVRRQFGLEAAQVGLGHSKADVTQLYAARDQALAAEVARAVG